VPMYAVGDQTFRRKNLYIPCAIDATIDDKTPAEQAAIYKATYWADNITNSQWPVVLDHDGASKVERSRLKRKGVGWVMALSRIAALNPDLYNQIVAEAKALYQDQIGVPSPMFRSDDDEDEELTA
jgi:hypothetical protein